MQQAMHTVFIAPVATWSNSCLHTDITIATVSGTVVCIYMQLYSTAMHA